MLILKLFKFLKKHISKLPKMIVIESKILFTIRTSKMNIRYNQDSLFFSSIISSRYSKTYLLHLRKIWLIIRKYSFFSLLWTFHRLPNSTTRTCTFYSDTLSLVFTSTRLIFMKTSLK